MRGIGRAENGKTMYSMNGACPGDVALVEIDRDKGNFCEGHVVEPLLRRRPIACCRHARLRVYAAVAVGNIYLTSVSLLRSAMPGVAAASHRRLRCAARRAHRWRMRAVEATKWNIATSSSSAALSMRSRASKWASIKVKRQKFAADACSLAHKQAQNAEGSARRSVVLHGSRRFRHPHRVGVRHSHRSRFEVALWTTPGPFPRNAVAKTLSTAKSFVNRARDDGRCGQCAQAQASEILMDAVFGAKPSQALNTA